MSCSVSSRQTCLELERYLQSEPYVSASELKFDPQEDLWSKLILACGDGDKGEMDSHSNADLAHVKEEDAQDGPMSETRSVNSDASSEVSDSSEELSPTHIFGSNPLGSGHLASSIIATPPSSPEALQEPGIPQLWGSINTELHVAGKARHNGTAKGSDKLALPGGDVSPDGRKRVHRCHFNGCRKVYTKSSHLKAHQRTHTGNTLHLSFTLLCV